MDIDGEAPKKKKVVKKHKIAFSTTTSSLDPAVIEKLKEQEAQMHAVDKYVMDTEVSSLSECSSGRWLMIMVANRTAKMRSRNVYNMRGKLDERYAAYVQPAERGTSQGPGGGFWATGDGC